MSLELSSTCLYLRRRVEGTSVYLMLDRQPEPPFQEPSAKSRFWCEEKFKELDSDQIEGGEFEFLGLEIRFERNKRVRFWRSIFNFRMKIDFGF